MRIEFEIELKDMPGQLVRALEPISKHGGNLLSVVHIRNDRKKGERIPVHVTLELAEPLSLEKILKELEERDILVSKINEIKKKERITVMVIGHVVDTDLRDTIDKLNAIKGVMVADLKLTMPHPEEETSALATIEITGVEKTKKVMEAMEKIAREKNLTLVKALGV